MKPLKISVSGIRGIAGETLTPEMAVKFAQSFGTYLDAGKVVIGRDTRVSGNMLRYAVISGLLSTGCEVVDIGIVPTPTLQLAVEKLSARGGIAITASHNSVDWNALIFIRQDGMFLNMYQGEELLDIFHEENFRKVGWTELKPTTSLYDIPQQDHLKTILNYFSQAKIRSKQFRVALDSCNGAAADLTQQLLTELGCTVIAINVDPTRPFPREPEPVSTNISDLCNLIRSNQVDIGFAQDADGDRLAIVSEQGIPLGEEYTLVLATEYWLTYEHQGPVVTNLSTTRAMDDITRNHQVPLIRTRVGDIYVLETMKNQSAVIGGEGNGGICVPDIHYAQDSLVAITLVLQYLATTNAPLSSLYAKLPKYYIGKRKIECPPEKVPLILSEITEFIPSLVGTEKMDLDYTDGIKINLPSTWIHLRPSGTEPNIRLIIETKTEQETEFYMNQIVRQIHKYL